MSEPMKISVEIEVQDIADAKIRKLTEDETLVEVVRCKNCKHFFNNKPHGILMMNLVCDKWGGGCRTDPDGFCFMGERKDDE